MPLLRCAETKNATQTRVCLLVPVSDAHSSSCHNVEAFKPSIFSDDSDETDVISEYIYIVSRRDSDSDFKLFQV